MQNGLQLNLDKSEAVVIGTAKQLQSTHLRLVDIAGVDLSVAEEMGVVLDQRLAFDNNASAVVRSCNYRAQVIRHIRHLLTRDLAQTLACSLILSRIDYCNAVLHGAPSGTIQRLQRLQTNAANRAPRERERERENFIKPH